MVNNLILANSFVFKLNSNNLKYHTSTTVATATSLLKMSERRRLKFERRRLGVLEDRRKLGGLGVCSPGKI